MGPEEMGSGMRNVGPEVEMEASNPSIIELQDRIAETTDLDEIRMLIGQAKNLLAHRLSAIMGRKIVSVNVDVVFETMSTAKMTF